MRDYKRFYAMCKALDKTKEDAVCEFTDGRTESCRDLSDEEFDDLFTKLAKLQFAVNKIPDDWEPKAGDTQRKKLIALAKNMYIGKPTKVILNILDEFCIRQKGKKMNDLSVAELGQVVTIYETKVYAGHLKGVNR